MEYIEYAKNSPEAEILFGGAGDKSVGYFVQPTVDVYKRQFLDHFSLLDLLFLFH